MWSWGSNTRWGEKRWDSIGKGGGVKREMEEVGRRKGGMWKDKNMGGRAIKKRDQ